MTSANPNASPHSRETFPWHASYPPSVAPSVDTSQYRSIVAFLDECFERQARDVAYRCMGQDLTYRELDHASRAVAAYLQSIGLKRGDRVAVMLPNILQQPVAVAGVLRAGLVVVNVNPLYTARELKWQLKDSGAKAIVLLNTKGHTLEKIIAETDVKHIIITSIGDLLGLVKGAAINTYIRFVRRLVSPYTLAGAVNFKHALRVGKSIECLRFPIGPEDLAVLQYTGGTTGTPKGAKLLHRNLVAAVLSAKEWLEPVLARHPPGEQWTAICVLPLYHVFAFVNGSLLSACTGARSILIPDPRRTGDIIRVLRHTKFRSINGVNTLFNSLLDHPKFASLDFSSLRVTVGGGMEISAVTARRWFETTGCPIAEGYGLTETTSGVCCNRLDLEEFTGSIGLPMPGVEIRILDDEGRTLTVGKEGEIAVRGATVMAGYWKNTHETAETMTDDAFLRTGDIGVMNDKGFICFLGRKKDVINVSGFMVYPIEIEAAVRELSGVLECAAVGAPDQRTGEAAWLFVVAEGLSQEDIRRHCRHCLAPYKRPLEVRIVPTLPTVGPGKIDRSSLRRLARAGGHQPVERSSR